MKKMEDNPNNKRKFLLFVSKELYNKIKELSLTENKSRTMLINEILESYFKGEKNEKL